MEHRLELFAVGLVENPRLSYSLEEGRKRVKEYVDGWGNLGAINKRSHTLRLQGSQQWGLLLPVGQGLLVRHSHRSVSFVRVPRIAASWQGVEEWIVDPPVTPFQLWGSATYSPEDVVALVEWKHP